MRLRLAGLMASAQRSMSLKAARDEAADHGVLGALGDFVDGGEIAVRGDREAGLDDVDAHGVEQFGDLELFLMGHGRARALLAVAQRRVEDHDAVLVGLGLASHGIDPSRRMRRLRALYGVLIPKIPRVPRRKWPSRPSGADKEKERAQNEGGHGFGLRRPSDRADALPRRHRLKYPRLRRLRSRNKVKSALTAARNGIFYWKGPGDCKRQIGQHCCQYARNPALGLLPLQRPLRLAQIL